jgi:hypothetical protein
MEFRGYCFFVIGPFKIQKRLLLNFFFLKSLFNELSLSISIENFKHISNYKQYFGKYCNSETFRFTTTIQIMQISDPILSIFICLTFTSK